MNKANVVRLLKSTKAAMSKHSPEILTGFGIAGMIATTVIAVKETPKALKLIEAEKERLELSEEDNLTPIEVIKVAWKPYIPAIAICAASVSCLIWSSSANLRRNAALATAYKLSENAFAEYKEKVVETIGEKKEKVIRDKVAQEQVNKNPVSKNEVFITEKGNTLCLDMLSKRYFKSDIDLIKKAENTINNRLLHEMYVSLNDFYELIGLSSSKLGDDLGWNIENGMLELDFSASISEEDKPCIVLDYNIAPQYNYYKIMR